MEDAAVNSTNKSATSPLLSLIDRLRKFADISASELIRHSTPDPLPTEIPIPKNIADVKIGQSSLGAPIFWALVLLRKRGVNFATGARITEIINQHLIDALHHKEQTNVSRALRHKTLQEQPWLVTVPGSHPTYGLTDNWKEHWLRLFNEPAPDF
jgi:hypothetical protein